MRTKKGFTLVEMMIVVAIIGVLVASLGWGAYQNSLKRSRDGRRKADLENIRSGLEMYRADKGYYPPSLSDLTSGGYIDAIPPDPLSPRLYPYNRTATTSYTLCAALEAETAPVPAQCGSCGTGVACNYKRTNP